MKAVAADSVALVVTSPPYFAGKEYEQVLGTGGVPGSYFEYLSLLREVFSECKRVLEPGGRIAVNVANLGRRPYRSLSGDVTAILEELGLLLRGEVVWVKGKAAGGSCAWGTFQHPSNPVLRDVTERIVIASKGRFDRALKPEMRRREGLPSRATITRDEFLDATTDLWELSPESATRVGHPAPFPVELPLRLIELYTYEDDVVLDPFMGSGTTAVAARRCGRRFIGYETDATYCARARERVRREGPENRRRPTESGEAAEKSAFERACDEGWLVKDVAEEMLLEAGFEKVRADVKLARAGLEVSFTARDQAGGEWAFDLSGAFSLNRSGLRRADALFRALAKAAVVHAALPATRFALLTTELPTRSSGGQVALAQLTGPGRPVHDVIEILRDADRRRLADYARGEPTGP